MKKVFSSMNGPGSLEMFHSRLSNANSRMCTPCHVPLVPTVIRIPDHILFIYKHHQSSSFLNRKECLDEMLFDLMPSSSYKGESESSHTS